MSFLIPVTVNNVNDNNVQDNRKLIINWGDISLDYHIKTENDFDLNSNFALFSNGYTFYQEGGAWFSEKLINYVLEKCDTNHEWALCNLTPEFASINRNIPNTFSIVAKYSEQEKEKRESSIWRIYQYFGRTNQSLTSEVSDLYMEKIRNWILIPKVLIISEYDQHIKNNENLWPIFLKTHNLPIIFMRLSDPLCTTNKLLKSILEIETESTVTDNGNQNIGELQSSSSQKEYKPNTLLLLTINDLIKNDIFIRQGLSWESTTYDLIKAFENELKDLKRAEFVIVVINKTGALLVEKGKTYTLYYSNREIEDGNEPKNEGDMRGLNTGLLMNIVGEFIKSNKDDITRDAVKAGIAYGLTNSMSAFKKGFHETTKDGLPDYEFPLDIMFEKIEKTPRGMSQAKSIDFPNNAEKESWSILSSWIKININEKDRFDKLITLVKEGEKPVFMDKIPYVNFGDLVIANNKEIEQYREIKKLINSYMLKENQNKPLSIAVFGEPGSGKSFGIQKVADSIPIKKPKILKFNLSQFTGIQDLVNAFQMIRDYTVKGKMVLCFWDEFDSKFEDESFGWVKYFLSPMQDGIFYDGAIMHSIGPSIFVFIGSQYHSMDQVENLFTKLTPDNNQLVPEKSGNTASEKNSGSIGDTKNIIVVDTKSEIEKDNNVQIDREIFVKQEAVKEDVKETDFNQPKLRDFISRLQGHLDILGINPSDNPSSDDLLELRLRRAIVLRSILIKHCITIFKNQDKNKEASIEDALVKALISVPRYKHGIRSMESIISMSHLDGRSRFNRSCLPANDQLKLHVDVDEFWKKMST